MTARRAAWRAALWLLLLVAPAAAQQTSALWGEDGEAWTPDGRLPDFSYAGYRFGEEPLPRVEVAANVRDFGATGDGQTDDTQAFLDAIAATERGAILVPAGRYVIRDILWIRKPHLVLRGEGPDATVLVFDTPLEELRPNMGATTSGRPTSNYSWSGGLVWVQGGGASVRLPAVVEDAARGSRELALAGLPDVRPGQRVRLEQRDHADRTLLDHLYSGDAGDSAKIDKPVVARMVSRVAAVDGERVTLERPLRWDVRAAWTPTLFREELPLREAGIEDLAFEFPVAPYKGHFTETGFNAIAMTGVRDCWIRNVRIANADSGVFLGGTGCTVEGLHLVSEREPHRGTTGHHGLSLGSDGLVTDFRFDTHFIHDITVSSGDAGNVVKNGSGINLSLDHHKKAPHDNLFCNLDLGQGSEAWRSGGGRSLGRHCGARGTFWGLRADEDIGLPPAGFGPASLNLVGVRTGTSSDTDGDGWWVESIPPDTLHPRDLHAAQLARRLRERTR